VKGIRRHGAGWQAEVRVKGHERSIRQFALDADPAEIQAWRKDEKARLRLTSPRATKGTFAADAKRYLSLVTTMPSFKMRKRDIGLWIGVFGTRARSSITRADIRAQRDRWHREGPKRVWRKHSDRHGGGWVDVPGPLAASTVNHRLRALANLYTVLDGRHAPNPARDVPEIEEEEGEDRSLPYTLIEMIIAAMPDRSQGKKGVKRTAVSLTKIRARVMAYVGLPPADIGRLTSERVNLDAGWVDTGKRKKGKGVLTGRRPLTPEGASALRAFVAAEAFGSFSTSSLLKSVRRACRKVADVLAKDNETAALAPIVRKIRPYDLRHSYVAEVLEKSGDFHATQLLSGHAELRTTMSYGRRAVNPALTAALAKVTAAGGFAAPANRATGETR
jgi:integrase